MGIPRTRAALVVSAVLVTALAVVWVGVGGLSPDGASPILGGALLAGGLLNCFFIYLARRRPARQVTRKERVSAEFRHEVERFLSEKGHGARRTTDEAKPARPAPPAPEPAETPRPLPPAEDLVARIGENLEILGGYREDLSALLRLYRLVADESLTLDERKKTLDEIKRFEKVIALAFLLEDAISVQDETRALLVDLRRSLSAEDGTVPVREEWTPVDLRDQIELVIRSLPEDRARSAFFDRHLGDLPLILSRPNTLFEAFYYVLDRFLDAAGPGKAIHIRTAQRGDDVWIGIGAGPVEGGAHAICNDRRVQAAEELWRELGGELTVGDGEVRILLPMHGPASVFSDRGARTAGEKTS
ncbi:MAG: hypothetical protein FJY73_13590 [Candidatus Eisenbacteria bacterium]|nr:hypothetical protein [Candidatus Eisenbacteria bacterium]